MADRGEVNRAASVGVPAAPGVVPTVGAVSVPGSASTVLRAVLAGPERAARVLGVFAAAVYLADADSGEVVTVCTHDAVRLPNAVVLAARTERSPFPALAGSTDARIGGGAVRLGPLRVDVVRWWTPPRPPAPGDVRTRAHGATTLRAALDTAATGLPAGARADPAELSRYAYTDPERAAGAALRLIGLGPGLTPSGDDVLCGFLLALRHLDPRAAGARHAHTLGARVAAHAPGRTTDLSAALLGHAARGDGCTQLIDLIGAMGRDTGVLPCLRRLLTVGHTSGADLALGVLAGAEAMCTGAAPAELPYRKLPQSPVFELPYPKLPYPEGRSAREQRA
ncbi:DUF2877 domain-containing protein [Embleya scabrispora]|uniref:DUF2877 domain-containing protein n=1 Tax=Embleya scabrispora TaxID=159449 RepID=UPI00117EE1B7|nr:DUF2877 domain-containing protein [Embleya scabrispora]